MKRFVYADNAATTKVHPEVFEAMSAYYQNEFGNPSSLYSIGAQARAAVDAARADVAGALGCKPSEVYFTSGGSEADNWALKGAAHRFAQKGRHLITTKFEHHAVLHTMAQLEKEGFEVTYLDVHRDGIVRVEDLRAAIRPDTILVSIMFANNEIGTIQPIEELAAAAHAHGILFHTDAVQAVGHVPIDIAKMGIDMLSLSAHKFHGPKGMGVLTIKNGILIDNLIAGGGQERGRRAGTENVAGIVGLARALTLAVGNMAENNRRVLAMRERLIDGLLKVPEAFLNGDRLRRLPGNVNIGFPYVEGESILLMLDMNGICASTGSACASGSLDPSHVLLSIGLPHELAHGSLRLSLSDDNTDEDIDYLLEVIPPVIEKLRAMSPLYEKAVK